MKTLYWLLGFFIAPVFSNKLVNQTNTIKKELYEIITTQEQESKNDLKHARNDLKNAKYGVEMSNYAIELFKKLENQLFLERQMCTNHHSKQFSLKQSNINMSTNVKKASHAKLVFAKTVKKISPVRVVPTKTVQKVAPSKAPVRLVPTKAVQKVAPVRLVLPKTVQKVAPAKAPVKLVFTKAVQKVAPTKVVQKVAPPKAPVKLVLTKTVQKVAPVRVVPTKALQKVAPPKAPVKLVPTKALQKVAPVKLVPTKALQKVKLPFTFSTATSSGDPHTDTFDGPHHDTMVSGWFTYVKNDVIDIKGLSQLGCMPPTIPNTCLRSVIVQINLSNGKSLYVSWGSWPPEGKSGNQNVIIHDSTGKSVNSPASSFRSDRFLNYKIAMQNGNLVISPIGKSISNPEKAVSVTIGPYFLAVTLPKTLPHVGNTNGLMGFFNGYKSDYAHIFRNKDGSSSKITTKSLCQRRVGQCGWTSQQKPEIINWAMTHATTITSPVVRILHSNSSHSVLPGFVPVVTIKKVVFCQNILKGTKIPKKKFASQMNSCLQDADSPSVARSIAKVIKVARKQQLKSKKALRKIVKIKLKKRNLKNKSKK